MPDFVIDEHAEYEIQCDGCAADTGRCTTEQETEKVARMLGFMAVDIEGEYGTVNLCTTCNAKRLAEAQ